VAAAKVAERLVIWIARHFLASWGILFAIVTIVKTLLGLSGSIMDIWFMTAAPFMFVLPLVVDPVRAAFGEVAGTVVWADTIAGIYVGLDAALWALIQSARRARAIASRTDGKPELGLRDRIDLSMAWLVRYGFSLWAIVTSAALFIDFGLHADFYEPNLKGLIVYGSLILALPIWPLMYIAGHLGLDLEDPVVRGVALSCFVIACVALDIAIKRWRRKAKDAKTTATSVE
jgi:hypothetical protein